MKYAAAKDVIGRLLESGAIEEVEFRVPSGNNAPKSVKGYRRSPD